MVDEGRELVREGAGEVGVVGWWVYGWLCVCTWSYVPDRCVWLMRGGS